MMINNPILSTRVL